MVIVIVERNTIFLNNRLVAINQQCMRKYSTDALIFQQVKRTKHVMLPAEIVTGRPSKLLHVTTAHHDSCQSSRNVIPNFRYRVNKHNSLSRLCKPVNRSFDAFSEQIDHFLWRNHLPVDAPSDSWRAGSSPLIGTEIRIVSVHYGCPAANQNDMLDRLRLYNLSHHVIEFFVRLIRPLEPQSGKRRNPTLCKQLDGLIALLCQLPQSSAKGCGMTVAQNGNSRRHSCPKEYFAILTKPPAHTVVELNHSAFVLASIQMNNFSRKSMSDTVTEMNIASRHGEHRQRPERQREHQTSRINDLFQTKRLLDILPGKDGNTE